MLDTRHTGRIRNGRSPLSRTTTPRRALRSPSRGLIHVLVNRNFALLWTGQVVTDLGSVIFNTTVLLWVGVVLAGGAAWGPLAVSGVLVAQTLPQVLLRPLAGVLVDRWDVRRTMLRTDALRAVLVALLTPVILLDTPTIWRLAAIYAAVLLVSVGSQFFNPALFALIGDLVPESDQPRASGLSETTWSVASVVGPPLAAPLLFLVGVQWALLLNAASFAVSYLTLRAIRTDSRKPIAPAPDVSPGEIPRPDTLGARPSSPAIPQAPDRSSHILAELREGFAYAIRNRVVRTVTVAFCVAMLGAGAFHALEIFFVTENLHTPPALYGLVGPAFSVGSVAGAVLAGHFATRLGVTRTFVLSMLGVGLALIVLARQTSLAPALGVYVLFGVVNAGANVALLPLLLGATPRALIGRVNAIFFTAISIVSLVSSALAGYLDSTLLRDIHLSVLGVGFGPIDILFIAAGICVCLGGVYAALELPSSPSPSESKSA